MLPVTVTNTSITASTAGKRRMWRRWSQPTGGDNMNVRVIAKAKGIRISRAKYNTAIPPIRMAAMRNPEERRGCITDGTDLEPRRTKFHAPALVCSSGAVRGRTAVPPGERPLRVRSVTDCMVFGKSAQELPSVSANSTRGHDWNPWVPQAISRGTTISALRRMLVALLNVFFGCAHQKTTFPISPSQPGPQGNPIGSRRTGSLDFPFADARAACPSTSEPDFPYRPGNEFRPPNLIAATATLPAKASRTVHCELAFIGLHV